MTSTAIQEPWTIPGADGEAILGNTLLPKDQPPIGTMIMVHGFLGYKDYGCFPYLAQRAALAGFVTHRFNLAHSGMTNDLATFARPDLFEKSTWRKTVFDINAVIDAIHGQTLAGAKLPYFLWGHSRGGVGVLLAAGHRFEQNSTPLPAGVISVAAPSSTCKMTVEQQELLLTRGYIETLSGRTGQSLRIGRDWLDDQRADPAWHDLRKATAAINGPLLIVHGTGDPTVNPADAIEIESFRSPDQQTQRVMVPGANHVFNTPNPFPIDGSPSKELSALVDAVLRFATDSSG